ncbi:MAG: hypothetical protein MZV63_60965 [Marinilabiliales bacterium]|nr:hypothetical protein [Marinilabiliales bacterium]
MNYEVQKDFIRLRHRRWAGNTALLMSDWDTTIGWDKAGGACTPWQPRRMSGLILWYNSAGDWNTVPYHPKDKLLTHESRMEEFSRLKAAGHQGHQGRLLWRRRAVYDGLLSGSYLQMLMSTI